MKKIENLLPINFQLTYKVRYKINTDLFSFIYSYLKHDIPIEDVTDEIEAEIYYLTKGK